MKNQSVQAEVSEQLRENSWVYFTLALSGAGILLLILLEMKFFGS